MRVLTAWLRRMTGRQLTLLLAAAIAATLFATVSWPMLRSSLQHAAHLRAHALQVQRQAADLEQSRTNPATAARFQAMAAAIPANPDLDTALMGLQRAAHRSGVSWVSSQQRRGLPVTVQAAGQPRRIVSYYLDVRVTGTPRQVADFTARVAQQPRLMVPQTLTETPHGADLALRVFALGEGD